MYIMANNYQANSQTQGAHKAIILHTHACSHVITMHIEQQEFVGLKLFCHDVAIYTVYIIHVIVYMYMYVNASITMHQHSCSSAIHAIDNGVFAEIDVGHLEKTNNFTIAVLKDEIQWSGKCTSIFNV